MQQLFHSRRFYTSSGVGRSQRRDSTVIEKQRTIIRSFRVFPVWSQTLPLITHNVAGEKWDSTVIENAGGPYSLFSGPSRMVANAAT